MSRRVCREYLTQRDREREKKADHLSRFSVYVYAHKGADRDVLRVGELVERAMGVGDKLKPYLAPQAEIRVGGREPESPESEGAERKAKGVAEAE
jgi:hypothetical protein